MKKFVQYTISSLLLIAFFMLSGTVHAATFNFDPTSSEVQPDNTFDVKINIDAGSQQVAGADSYILYDTSFLEVQTVTDGDYFPTVDNNPVPGRLYINGLVTSQGDYKTGPGTVATLRFKAIQEGTATLTFECDTSKGDTSKIIQNDINVTNILDCSNLSTHTVTISESATDGGTDTTNELPQSGVVEDMIQYSIWGGILIGFGAVLRLLLRVI